MSEWVRTWDGARVDGAGGRTVVTTVIVVVGAILIVLVGGGGGIGCAMEIRSLIP
jgi:hypothetical protein